MDATITIDTPEVGEVGIPKYVFIVPYRDREPHRVFFSTYIYKIMEDIPREDWTFYFIHQNDKRPFNRGAMKNIGFLALKEAYQIITKISSLFLMTSIQYLMTRIY